MTNIVAFSPHNDDVELFASQQLVEHRPHVIVVFRSQIQQARGTGITFQQRERETAAAMDVFGLSWHQWEYPDSEPLPSEGRARIAALSEIFDACIAPAVEPGGHEQHNDVGSAALAAFGPERTIRYMTYQRASRERSRGVEVKLDAETIRLKHLALACHASQIAEPSTGHWFANSLQEWVLP